MTNECRPPDGTPDGTVCVLQKPIRYSREREVVDWERDPFVWARNWFGAYRWFDIYRQEFCRPAQLTRLGYCFHSTATPPGENA